MGIKLHQYTNSGPNWDHYYKGQQNIMELNIYIAYDFAECKMKLEFYWLHFMLICYKMMKLHI